jgi:hypothetical protein
MPGAPPPRARCLFFLIVFPSLYSLLNELTIILSNISLLRIPSIAGDPSLLLESGLDCAAREIAASQSDQLCLAMGLLDSPRKRAENTLLLACHSRAAIPNMLANFFEHYCTGDLAGFFPAPFNGDKGTVARARSRPR